MAEHIGRYNWLINKLNEDGYHVTAIDHRGHGKRVEDNLKGYFADKDGWDHVVNDLVDIIEESSREFPDLKQYLIGHSMGSWISLGAIQKGINIDCCVLSGSSKVPKNLIKSQRIIISFLITFFGKKSTGYFLDRMILGEYNKTNNKNLVITSSLDEEKLFLFLEEIIFLQALLENKIPINKKVQLDAIFDFIQ